MVKLFSKNSNLCDHNSPTSQTDGRTDRQTTCDRNTALCTKVHRAVKSRRTTSYNAQQNYVTCRDVIRSLSFRGSLLGGRPTAAAAPPPTAVRPSDPALCGSCPLVTPYCCRLGDLLCFIYVYRYSCSLLSVHVCFVLFPLLYLSFVDFPSVLRYCWLGLLTCKNRLPYNLYCVGGDVKHCTIDQSAYTLMMGRYRLLKSIRRG